MGTTFDEDTIAEVILRVQSHLASFYRGMESLGTPATPSNKMGSADPGLDIGCFARAALDRGPGFMEGQEAPVCGLSISSSDLAANITALRGIKAEYRKCSPEEFEASG